MRNDDFMARAAKHHAVPAVGRALEAAKMKVGGGKGQSAGTKADGQHSPEHEAATAEHVAAHGPVKSHTVTKHADGSAHVVAQHEDGHAHIHQHPSEASAHSHAHHMMSAGGDGMSHGGQDGAQIEHPDTENRSNLENPGGTDEEAMSAKAEGGPEDDEAGECPECGAQMQGGKCEQCGYSASEKDGAEMTA